MSDDAAKAEEQRSEAAAETEDKEGQRTEARAAAAGQAQAEATAAAGEAEAAGETVSLLSDVYTVMRFSLGLFLQQAWISLGLRAAPGASETKTDLEQARMAIDAAAYLFERLEPVASEEERKEVELELTNLRINFARKAG